MRKTLLGVLCAGLLFSGCSKQDTSNKQTATVQGNNYEINDFIDIPEKMIDVNGENISINGERCDMAIYALWLNSMPKMKYRNSMNLSDDVPEAYTAWIPGSKDIGYIFTDNEARKSYPNPYLVYTMDNENHLFRFAKCRVNSKIIENLFVSAVKLNDKDRLIEASEAYQPK